jgi:hypothetical protein
MALHFETAQFTSTDDLIRTKLDTFLVAHGWTQDHSVAGKYAAHVDSLFMSFRWDTTVSSGAQNIGVYQALGFAGTGTDPGNHTSDSGQGVVSGTNVGAPGLDDGRCCDMDNGTHQYWFFLSDAAPKYCHVVVEHATATAYRHFGMGHLSKYGTWTGGEYSYADRHRNEGATANLAIDTDNSTLLDGLASGSNVHTATTGQSFLASLHAEALTEEDANTKWLLCWAGGIPAGNDRQSTPRARGWALGGTRSGLTMYPFARYFATPLQGLIPLTPINIYHPWRTTTTRTSRLGTIPNARMVNMRHFVGGQELVIGSETWVVFPAREKGVGATTGHGTRNQGIAYRKS